MVCHLSPHLPWLPRWLSDKCLPTQETWVRSLGREDPLEEKMAAHSSIFAWRIPWTEEPGGLQFMGSRRLGDDWEPNTLTWSLTSISG